MGEGCCTQHYPCICKEAVSGFEPMTNKSPRHNFTAAPGLALNRMCVTRATELNDQGEEWMCDSRRGAIKGGGKDGGGDDGGGGGFGGGGGCGGGF
ncbi:hypothetical protein HKD37_16G045788 [Glycine soja]